MLAPPAANAVRERPESSGSAGDVATAGRSWLTHAEASLTACARWAPARTARASGEVCAHAAAYRMTAGSS